MIFSVVQGASRYARLLRRTLWLVMVADVLLPLWFPAGMIAFLFVHAMNVFNFGGQAQLGRDHLASLALPCVLAFGVSILLYALLLFPSMDALFRVLVGVYLVPIALAWALSITGFVQRRSRGTLAAAVGMTLFYCTDLQVAVEFLTDARIPHYGLVNALTYYAGLYGMARATRWMPG